MHTLIFGFILLSTIPCAGQSIGTRIGARHAGMGYASFTLYDEAALFNNVGAIARIDEPSAFFCYEVAADLPGANRTAAALTAPTGIGTIAFGVFRFGDDVYSEHFISAGFSHQLGATSLGAKVNYVQYLAHGFETRTAVTVDFGGLTQLTPEVYVGAGIFNLTQSRIAEDEQLPVILVAAVGYQPDSRLHLTAEVEKQLGSPLRIKGSMEYGVAGKVFFRSGFNINPMALFFGIGAHTRRANFDFNTKFSYVLGFAHQASATYRLVNSRGK